MKLGFDGEGVITVIANTEYIHIYISIFSSAIAVTYALFSGFLKVSLSLQQQSSELVVRKTREVKPSRIHSVRMLLSPTEGK